MNVSKTAKQGLLFTQTGTPYYASPEVWRNLPYDLKSDIWSLGCVLYEMAALHPPFRANSMEELYVRVTSGVIPRLGRRCSSEFFDFVKKLLQLNPQKRPTCSMRPFIFRTNTEASFDFGKGFESRNENSASRAAGNDNAAKEPELAVGASSQGELL